MHSRTVAGAPPSKAPSSWRGLICVACCFNHSTLQMEAEVVGRLAAIYQSERGARTAEEGERQWMCMITMVNWFVAR